MFTKLALHFILVSGSISIIDGLPNVDIHLVIIEVTIASDWLFRLLYTNRSSMENLENASIICKYSYRPGFPSPMKKKSNKMTSKGPLAIGKAEGLASGLFPVHFVRLHFLQCSLHALYNFSGTPLMINCFAN